MISNTVKTIFVLCFCVNHQHAKIGPKPGGSIIKLACPLSFRSFFKKLYIDTRYPHSWHWKSRLWCLWAWIVLTKKVSPGLKLILPTWLLQQGSKITFFILSLQNWNISCLYGVTKVLEKGAENMATLFTMLFEMQLLIAKMAAFLAPTRALGMQTCVCPSVYVKLV